MSIKKKKKKKKNHSYYIQPKLLAVTNIQVLAFQSTKQIDVKFAKSIQGY